MVDSDHIHIEEHEIPFLSQSMPPSPQPSANTAQSNLSFETEVSYRPSQSCQDANIKRRLYVSHCLSTWNSRVFEFGAVLLLAQIYEGTLLPTSLYALIRAASAMCLSPMAGRYIDRGNRLKVVRLSIIGQRVAVIISCPGFWALGLISIPSGAPSAFVFGSLAILACVEKLCSIINLISIERDWVVVVSENSQISLEVLNSQMRRIDLICKVLGPLVIAVVDAKSLQLAIEVIFGMNVISLLIEYIAIAGVYESIPALQCKHLVSNDAEGPVFPHGDRSRLQILVTILSNSLRGVVESLSNYLRHAAFLPSFALCLLYLTVLSFSGQMVTYLVSIGLTAAQIGLLRAVSTTVEISATWLAPLAMTRIGPLRSGLWFINWQIFCLCAAVIPFWCMDGAVLAAYVLVCGMIASRVGLWGFDLCVQIIVQEVGFSLGA